MLNILTTPIIKIKRNQGRIDEVSLPETLAALMADDVAAFPALRPHQRHAWHAFLVQLGAMAMHKAGLTEPPPDAHEWRSIIRALTPDFPDDEPWQLVVEDITKPAFMQPPASSAEREKDHKSIVATADELDMLVTSKNHDLKASVGAQGNIDDWLFALITLQTMEGFSGAGNYGISRMNGGLGNRPMFTLAPVAGDGMSINIGTHVRRDIKALLECSMELVSEYRMKYDGIGLLWKLPWDGTVVQKFLLPDLSPFYIEVCRRIRLRAYTDGNLYAIRSTTKAARVEAKAFNGRTGDPWTPINQKESKALTLAKGGFTYKRIVDYLMPNGDWDWPALLRSTQSDPDDMALVARAMVRGQGKTEGYYERVIPISHKVKTAMMGRASTQELGDIAKERISDVGKVQRILRHAVSVFAAGGGDSISDEARSRANPWANRLDDIVDATFFDDLQYEFEEDESGRQAIREEWLLNPRNDNGFIDENGNGVINRAKRILQDAEDSLPCNEMRRYKARTRAEGVFEGRIRGNTGIPGLFP